MAVELSLLEFGSLDVATVPVLEIWVRPGGCRSLSRRMLFPSTVTAIRTIWLVPGAMSPRLTLTVPLTPTTTPGLEQTVSGAILQLKKFVNFGRGSVKVTELAVFGPLFVTLML